MKLNGESRTTKLFVKKLLCCYEDESYIFPLDVHLSSCQAVVTIKSIHNGNYVMMYEVKMYF